MASLLQSCKLQVALAYCGIYWVCLASCWLPAPCQGSYSMPQKTNMIWVCGVVFSRGSSFSSARSINARSITLDIWYKHKYIDLYLHSWQYLFNGDITRKPTKAKGYNYQFVPRCARMRCANMFHGLAPESSPCSWDARRMVSEALEAQEEDSFAYKSHQNKGLHFWKRHCCLLGIFALSANASKYSEPNDSGKAQFHDGRAHRLLTLLHRSKKVEKPDTLSLSLAYPSNHAKHFAAKLHASER